MRSVRGQLLLLLLTPVCAMTNELSIERIFGDPSLAGATPRAVKVSPDGRRVGLLRGRATDQHQLDLWVYDTADSALRLRVDSQQLAPAEQPSQAELARRERERIADFHGIVDYDWAPDGRHLLFTLGGNLYLYDLEAGADTALRRLTHGQQAQAAIDAQVSPKGRYVSFVRDQNLYVIDLADGQEHQLTSDGGGTLHNAEAEFVAQEEMKQTSGYWWAPDDSAIAYKQFDDSAVPVARRFEVYAEHVDVVEQRYPAAGDPNVRVKLGLVAPAGGATRWIGLGADPDVYLVRADWTPDARQLLFQRLSRDQHRLDLVLVAAATLQQTPLLTEASDAWVNLSADLHFLKRQPALVWSSERSGQRHLYLIGFDRRVRPLTAGNWQIDELLAVDESSGLVYFASNKEAVADEQIYVARLDGQDPGHPRRISQGAGWHAAQFARDALRVSLYVDTYSDPTTPPQVSVNGPDGRRLAWVEANPLDSNHPYWPYYAQHVVPEFGHIRTEDGQELQYAVMKPPDFDPSRRYPALINVYGGPTVQRVQRHWPDMINEYMAQHGYVVFMLDNRGTPRRGRAFEDAIHLRLGAVEVHDQLAGTRWLERQPWIDPKHIGVFGWSYGGYMTLMLLAKGSDIIAAGAAVAPVTDWRLYDTCYTERYLGSPRDNPQGYADSAVFSALDGLKSPLFLAHGMADDNVLFVHSTRLMSELQRRGIQFELMTYPGAKHGLLTPQMKTHVYTAIQRFFDAHLKTSAGRLN